MVIVFVIFTTPSCRALQELVDKLQRYTDRQRNQQDTINDLDDKQYKTNEKLKEVNKRLNALLDHLKLEIIEKELLVVKNKK